jgi:hypothetical protein
MSISPSSFEPRSFAQTPQPVAANVLAFTHRFDLGAILVTPRALRALQRFGVEPCTLLHRHASGDWGEVDLKQRQINEGALCSGDRLVSMYALCSPIGAHPLRETLYALTEGNRMFTTLQMPDDGWPGSP